MVAIELTSSDVEVLCAFWKDSRFSFGVRVCDSLIEGVLFCVVNDFYPDVDPFDNVDDWLNGKSEGVVGERCKHFVYSDSSAVKQGCYFGNLKCVNSGVKGFSACIGCEKWLKK